MIGLNKTCTYQTKSRVVWTVDNDNDDDEDDKKWHYIHAHIIISSKIHEVFLSMYIFEKS